MIFYDFIASASFDRFVELLERAANHPKLIKSNLDSMIDQAIKYKYKKVLHFQDLREIFVDILQKYEVNLF